ncbi:MAG: peptidylprolyl isomerase, partial [Pseudomonadales bacterium]|nr:peptidylprolyl isomerase [Pseudomonadales bacterium]
PVSPSMSQEEINRIQALADSITQRANAGEDFHSLAATYSKAPDALDGGDLGWRKKSQMPSIYGERIESLDIGQTTRPFRSNAGIHIISLLDKQGFSDQVIMLTKASHILIKPTAIRNETEVVELLNQIRKNIDAGASFSEMAKKYTDDIGTALNGGSLDWVSPGQMVSEFETVMNNTPKGEISQPFHTQFGWHIVKVDDRKQKDISDDMLRNQAKNFLYNRKFEEQLALWQNEIRNDAYIEIK